MPKDEFGNEIEADEFGNQVEKMPDSPAPMGTGEEMMRTGRKMVNGAMFGLLPQAAGAIDATVPQLADEHAQGPTWMDRYHGARDNYQAGLDEDSKKLRHPDIDEFVGGLATGGALRKVLPSGLNAIRKAPKLLRAALGIGEASALNAGVGAAKNFDDPDKAKQAALEGATSPVNALGAAGPLLESLAPLFAKASLNRTARSLPFSGSDAKQFRANFGSPEDALKFLRDTKMPNGTPLLEAGDTPETILSKIKSFKDAVGKDKQAFVDLADSVGRKGGIGAQVDVTDVFNKIQDVFKDVDTPGNRVMLPKTVDGLARTIGRLMDEAGYKGPGVVHNPKITTMDDWEGIKTKIMQAVSDRLKSGKVSTPVQSAMGDIASIIKEADETALEGVLGPDVRAKFVETKDLYGKLASFAKVAEKSANQAAATPEKESVLRRLLPLALGASGIAAHDPSVGVAAAAGGMALDRAGAAFDSANPRMARSYDWLRRHLPDTPGTSVAPLLLKRSLGKGDDQ